MGQTASDTSSCPHQPTPYSKTVDDSNKRRWRITNQEVSPVPAPSKGNPPPEHKLNDAQAHEVCTWIAQFESIPSILKKIESEFGITVNRGTVHYYKKAKRWAPLIERARQEWAASIMDVPIAHKKKRMESLHEQFEEVIQEAADPKFNRSPIAKRAELRQILKQAQEEMDEKTTNFTTIYATQIQNYSDDELIHRQQQLIMKLKQLGGSNARQVIPKSKRKEIVYQEPGRDE